MLAIGSANAPRHAVPVPNYIFDGTMGWQKKKPESHPTLLLTVTTDATDYSHLRLRHPRMSPTKAPAVTDTGAQSNLLGLKMLYMFGLKKSDLVPVRSKLNAINGEGIVLIGAVFLRLSALDTNTGKRVSTAVMAYVTESTDCFYISRQAMTELGIIDKEFPKVNSTTVSGISEKSANKKADCGCHTHQLPPNRPDKLPFKPSAENVDNMKTWLLDRYAASTFNKCPHQRLPLMKGDPIKIHIDPAATPVAVYTAATVPIHWRDQVQAQLDEDEALGVIEKVPLGVPTTWQARMHIACKADGSPRRTLDFRSLNTHCV